jgi:Winged helix-turn-helix DNA-binding
MGARRWTKDHDATLRVLWKNPRLKLRDIAEVVGFSPGQVGARARKLKLPPRPPFVVDFDVEKFAEAWTNHRCLTANILRSFRLQEKTASMVAAVMGLAPRTSTQTSRPPPVPDRPEPRPLIIGSRRIRPCVAAPPAPVIAAPRGDPADIDIIASKGRYARLADIAAERDMTLAEVQRRFHLLRAAS